KTSMDPQDFFVPHFFITHQIDEKFSVGTGVSAPFGLGTRWPSEWIGRYLAIETELQVLSVPLVVSWMVTDNFAISIGGSYNHATVLIKQKTPQTPFEGDAFVEMEGDDAAAFGYNFAFMWKPSDIVSIGGSFKSQVSYTFEGTAKTTGAEQLSARFPSGDISAELNTPVNIHGGVAVQVLKQLRLSADFQFVGWSSYDKLAVDIADPDIEDISQPRDYTDSYILRLGGEFFINERISLLGGIYYDKFPVEADNVSPSLPDSDRLGFSFGIDAKITNNLGVTGSYLFIRSDELTVTNSREQYTSGNSPFNGTYNSKANLFSLSFYYSFN
ncbi:MAG: outer membrane protein transport protein, partial [Ignavibacteria bacterium]